MFCPDNTHTVHLVAHFHREYTGFIGTDFAIILRMIQLVHIALRRPYTFVVLAILIVIFGTMSVLHTPTDVFPNILIPVTSVVWAYDGLPTRRR